MPEVMMGIAIMAVMFVSLYVGISGGFQVTRVAREDLRATQIMLERMEGVRLYNWDQLCYSNFIPTKFTNYYYPLGMASGTNPGVQYRGTFTITNVNMSPSATYSTNMRLVKVTLEWDTGSLTRKRSMSTLATRYGVQNYVFAN